MRLLICSDGHAQAAKAIRFIAPIAAHCGAETTVLGIIEQPRDEAALTDALRQQMQILQEQNVSAELIAKRGRPIEEIQKRTKETHYDLVVIGAERKSGRPIAMSAKAYGIVKTILPPVLVVMGGRAPLQRILICSGGRNDTGQATALIGQFANKPEVSVTLLHVLPEPPALYADLIARENDVEAMLGSSSALGRHLRREIAALEAQKIQAGVQLRHGLVVDEILNEVKQGDYDLVVTGSAQTGDRLRTYVLGDVTSEILNRADCPVLIVRCAPIATGFFARLTRLFSTSKG